MNYHPKNLRTLKRDALPTLNLPNNTSVENVGRSNRARKRSQQKLVDELLSKATDVTPASINNMEDVHLDIADCSEAILTTDIK